VISAQGRAIVLAQDPQDEQLSIARSSVSGQSWDSMPLPPELAKNRDDRCGRCTLTLAADPRNPAAELLFFRQGAIDADYIDDAIEAQSLNVWWWNEAEQNWRLVLQSGGSSARSRPLALGEPLSPKQGKRMMSMGWHLAKPVLWMQH
jgi:hypothetical protein